MRKSLIFALPILLLCFSLNALAQKNLETLYRNQQYFQLRDALKNVPIGNSPDAAFYRGAVLNKFNRPVDSAALLLNYLQTTSAPPTAKIRADALEILANDYVKTYQYARAADVLKTLLRDFKSALEADKIAEFENDSKVFGAIREVAPQTISFGGDTQIQATRDKANLLNIPVEINAQKMDFVFDTGANFSTVTISTAKKLNLQIIEADFDIGSSTKERVKSKLAVAPELKIGNVTVHNAVFLVLDDAALSFPKINYQIDGIIGFPVIEAICQITIDKSDLLTIPAQAVKKQAAQNLCLEGLMPLIEGSYNNQPMIFEFDTGAVTTTLYALFFESQKAQVLNKYKPQESGIGGVGGAHQVNSYKLENVSLEVAGKTARFPSIDLLPETINKDKVHLYGTFGQDLIKQFDKMTLDFQAMSVSFE